MYHGSNMVIGEINLKKSRLRTDFGRGFYLTDSIETAQNWAARRVSATGGVATIIRYEISNDVFMLPGKRFESTPSLEWLEFIVMNRKRNAKSELMDEPRHTHCWVSGPIADDKIADVVENYLAGDINSVEAIALARALPQVFQLSLHTQSSLSVIDENSVQIKQFKDGKWSKDWVLRKR
jgi:hypothetical protein